MTPSLSLSLRLTASPSPLVLFLSLLDPLFVSLRLHSFQFLGPLRPAQAVLGRRIDWGFYSPSLTCSLYLSPSLGLGSPVYRNTQTSLMCVFVSVSLLLL